MKPVTDARDADKSRSSRSCFSGTERACVRWSPAGMDADGTEHGRRIAAQAEATIRFCSATAPFGRPAAAAASAWALIV